MGAHKRRPPALPAVGATLVVARFAHRVPPDRICKARHPGPSPGSQRPPGRQSRIAAARKPDGIDFVWNSEISSFPQNPPPTALYGIIILTSDSYHIVLQGRCRTPGQIGSPLLRMSSARPWCTAERGPGSKTGAAKINAPVVSLTRPARLFYCSRRAMTRGPAELFLR